MTRDGILLAMTQALNINGVSCYDIGVLTDTLTDCLAAAGHAEPEPPAVPDPEGVEWWIVEVEDDDFGPRITVAQWFGLCLQYWHKAGKTERFKTGIKPIRRIEHEGLYDED